MQQQTGYLYMHAFSNILLKKKNVCQPYFSFTDMKKIEKQLFMGRTAAERRIKNAISAAIYS